MSHEEAIKTFESMSKIQKAKLICQIDEDEKFSTDEHFFEIGLARAHGFMENRSLRLTEKGNEEAIRILMFGYNDDEEDED